MDQGFCEAAHGLCCCEHVSVLAADHTRKLASVRSPQLSIGYGLISLEFSNVSTVVCKCL